MNNKLQSKKTLGSFIFLSRWLQAPLYLGLIVAQAVYVYRFLLELWHLIGFALFNHAAPASIPKDVTDPEVERTFIQEFVRRVVQANSTGS